MTFFSNCATTQANYFPDFLNSSTFSTNCGSRCRSFSCVNFFERVIIVYDHVLVRGEPVSSEKAAIRRFLEYVHALDPDVITGWNVVDFDLAFLARAAQNRRRKA